MHEPDDDWRTVHEMGHRNFVGGNDQYWDSIGRLQFDFLKAQGLSPLHTLFDIGCGSLRAGIKLIEYLDPDRYIGIDKHIEPIIYGVALELGIDTFRTKRPRFLVSDSFEFWKISTSPDFAIAQSLFTHLTIGDISKCFAALKSIADPGCRFFATFFEAPPGNEWKNPAQSHSHGLFRYTRSQIEGLGMAEGWRPRYIGEWNHPRGQKIFEFTAN